MTLALVAHLPFVATLFFPIFQTNGHQVKNKRIYFEGVPILSFARVQSLEPHHVFVLSPLTFRYLII